MKRIHIKNHNTELHAAVAICQLFFYIAFQLKPVIQACHMINLVLFPKIGNHAGK